MKNSLYYNHTAKYRSWNFNSTMAVLCWWQLVISGHLEIRPSDPQVWWPHKTINTMAMWRQCVCLLLWNLFILPQKNVNTASWYLVCVDAFYRPTHDRARSRGARRSSLQHLLRGVVRPVRGTGQTGRRAERWRSDERSPGRDPVGASARRVVLGSAGQLGRPQTPWRREKNNMSRLEKLG